MAVPTAYPVPYRREKGDRSGVYVFMYTGTDGSREMISTGTALKAEADRFVEQFIARQNCRMWLDNNSVPDMRLRSL